MDKALVQRPVQDAIETGPGLLVTRVPVSIRGTVVAFACIWCDESAAERIWDGNDELTGVDPAKVRDVLRFANVIADVKVAAHDGDWPRSQVLGDLAKLVFANGAVLAVRFQVERADRHGCVLEREDNPDETAT